MTESEVRKLLRQMKELDSQTAFRDFFRPQKMPIGTGYRNHFNSSAAHNLSVLRKKNSLSFMEVDSHTRTRAHCAHSHITIHPSFSQQEYVLPVLFYSMDEYPVPRLNQSLPPTIRDFQLYLPLRFTQRYLITFTGSECVFMKLTAVTIKKGNSYRPVSHASQ